MSVKCLECSYIILNLENKLRPRCGNSSFTDSKSDSLKENVLSPTLDNDKTSTNQTVKDHHLLKRTIKGRQNSESKAVPEFISCSNCGYPKENEAAECPKCETVSKDREGNKKTISITNFSFEEEGILLQLSPLKEDHKAFKLKLTENEVVLNRESFKDDDPSISSNSHITLTQTEGKVFLENKSSNDAVFFKVENRIELKNGDVILLGKNKYYKVEL